jgi:hypothetical protein
MTITHLVSHRVAELGRDTAVAVAGAVRRSGDAARRRSLSYKSFGSVLSASSVLSVASAVSLLSIGSFMSILSIGSSHSILSIGSSGGVLSIGYPRRSHSRRSPP